VLNQTPVPLTVGNESTSGSLDFEKSKLYAFHTGRTGQYYIRWDDFENNDSLGDITVTLYDSAGAIVTGNDDLPIEEAESSGFEVLLSGSVDYRIVVDCSNINRPGDYSISVAESN
jgi:hypothetical protein